MDWTACTATIALAWVLAGVVWLAVIAGVVALCRAAALAERRMPEPVHAATADAPPHPPPRTPHELVACVLISLDVEHATLFVGSQPERLRLLSRGHLDVRADAEPHNLHLEAAAAALQAGDTIEYGGVAPAAVVAAAPVTRGGRAVGALAVSVTRATRGRLTFAERRSLAQLAAQAAALPALHRRARVRRAEPR
jgi:hypothetical protein